MAGNYKQVEVWFVKAAEHGDAQAQYTLRVRFLISEKVALAMKWFQKAAERGDAEAQFRMGMGYKDGRGVPQVDEQTFAWLEKAAQQGYMFAECEVAFFHLAGKRGHRTFGNRREMAYKGGRERRCKRTSCIGLVLPIGHGCHPRQRAGCEMVREGNCAGLCRSTR
jgi:TPR repeat protein